MTSAEQMQVILKVASASGSIAKQQILRANPGLLTVLISCYNPYVQYYIKPTEHWATTVGTEMFDSNTSQLLIALSSRKLTGSAAKKAVIIELNRLEPLSQSLLLRILNKDMRMGVQAKTINKVWPGAIPEFSVQLAKLYEPGKITWPCLGSFKIDGLRCIYENEHMYSRYGREFQGLDNLIEGLRELHVARIDGEIIVPGKSFDDLSGDIRSFNNSPDARYMVFDVHMPGNPLPLYKRQEYARLLCQMVNSPQICYVEHRTLRSETEAMDMYAEARDLGYEGLVIKKEDGLPYNGRNNDWLKLKPHDTIDLEVIGIEEGQGKYAEKVGALVCDLDGVDVHIGGGLSDYQRDMWMADPNLIVGKTIEVEYMELSKEGRLRHPRLKKVRGDK